MKKICSKCKQEKTIEEFYKNKSKKDGCCSICKICTKQYRREYHQEHKEQRKQYCREYRFVFLNIV